MAWRDPVRRPYAVARVFSDLSFGTRLVQWEEDRLLSIDVVEEAPCPCLKRRVSECSVRVTNDIKTNSDGVRVPVMGALGTDDPTAYIGKVLRVYIREGSTTDERWIGTYIVDGVEADDSGATLHALGVDSLMDRTFDEAGVSSAVTTSLKVGPWCKSMMAACGIRTTGMIYPSDLDVYFPGAYDFGSDSNVYDAVVAIAGAYGYAVGFTDAGSVPTIGPLYFESKWADDEDLPFAMTGFVEPAQNDTYGKIVVKDPWAGTEQTFDPGTGLDGVLYVSVPFSSLGGLPAGMDFIAESRGGPWYRADLVGDPKRIHASQYNADLGDIEMPSPMVMRWVEGPEPDDYGFLEMDAWRIEHRYEGGFSQRVYGPARTWR